MIIIIIIIIINYSYPIYVYIDVHILHISPPQLATSHGKILQRDGSTKICVQGQPPQGARMDGTCQYYICRLL
jgi:hypothetical protein